ncbi:MAG TPA: SBBP repeat-containing protein [Casimicrobiaceae bacterium]|nr:SBBP repeat-containing protein [Casimicrobiaceae bacterium]
MLLRLALLLARTVGQPRRLRLLLPALIAVAWSVAQAAAPAWLVSAALTLGGDPTVADITSIAVDGSGDNVVAGTIRTTRFPGIDSGQVINAGYGARFVARYDALSGAQRFAVAVGASSREPRPNTIGGMALDAAGNAYLPAYAASLDLPASGSAYVAAGRAYIFRVSALGQVTRLGPGLDPAIRSVHAVVLDGAGNLFITGAADAGLVTSTGAPYGTAAVAAGCVVPYVAKLDASAQTVLYATYLGYSGTQGERCGGSVPLGPFDPSGYALAVDTAGNAYVTGQAEPGVRATSGAVDRAPTTPSLLLGGYAVASHAFVSKLNATGTALLYSARLGGSYHDRGTAIVIDGAGNAYVAGKTSGRSFPTAGVGWPVIGVIYECLLNTPEYGFVAKLSPDASLLQWSGLVAAAGDALDDCTWSGVEREAPLSLVTDGAGALYTAGYSVSSNRVTTLSRNAMQSYGDGFFAQIDVTGNLLYSTWVSGTANALALDAQRNVRVAGGALVQQLSAGDMPVRIDTRFAPNCAGVATTLDVRVAGAGDAGTVDIQVDGVSVGFSALRGGLATITAALANGVRRIAATYHGPGWFDGYASTPVYIAIDPAGACG